MCEQNLTLNNLQGLVCHKTQPINFMTIICVCTIIKYFYVIQIIYRQSYSFRYFKKLNGFK